MHGNDAGPDWLCWVIGGGWTAVATGAGRRVDQVSRHIYLPPRPNPMACVHADLVQFWVEPPHHGDINTYSLAKETSRKNPLRDAAWAILVRLHWWGWLHRNRLYASGRGLLYMHKRAFFGWWPLLWNLLSHEVYFLFIFLFCMKMYLFLQVFLDYIQFLVLSFLLCYILMHLFCSVFVFNTIWIFNKVCVYVRLQI